MSSGFRHRATVVLGVVAQDDEVKDLGAGGFIREDANLVSLDVELAEEALQEVG